MPEITLLLDDRERVISLGENTTLAALKAAEAKASALAAETARQGVETIRDASLAMLNPAASKAAGEAATPVGEAFGYIDASDQLILAKRTAGGSSELDEYLGASRLKYGVSYASPLAYAAGIDVASTATTVSYNGALYAPRASALPFTTGATFDAAKWRAIKLGFERFWTPEMFGASDELSLADETNAVLAAFRACRETGLPLVLNRLYAVRDLQLTDAIASGVTVLAHSSMGNKSPIKWAKRGFMAYEDGQNHIVRIGDAVTNDKVSGISWHGVLLHGRDFTLANAGMVLSRVAEGHFHSSVNRRMLSPAITMRRAEDIEFWGLDNTFLGANDGRPIVEFSNSYGGLPGNNVIRFFGGRHEFCDGPFFGSAPNTGAFDCWADVVELTDIKLESGSFATAAEGELGLAARSYGASMEPGAGAGYAALDFRHCHPSRLSLDAHDIHVARAHAFSWHARVGSCRRFRMDNWTLNANGDKTLPLFDISMPDGSAASPRGFEYTNARYSNYSGNFAVQTGDRIKFNNNSRIPIRYRRPRFSDIGGVVDFANDAPGFFSASEYASHAPDNDNPGNYLIQDFTAPGDPALSIGKTILPFSGLTAKTLFEIGNTAFAGRPIGLNGKIGAGDLIVHLRVRTENNAGTPAALKVTGNNGATVLGSVTVPVNVATWTWYKIRVPQKLLTDDMRLDFLGTDAVYKGWVDCWRFEWDDWSTPRTTLLGRVSAGAAFNYAFDIKGVVANNTLRYRLFIDMHQGQTGAARRVTYEASIAIFTGNDGAASWVVDLVPVISAAGEWTTVPAVSVTDDGAGNGTLTVTGDPLLGDAYGTVMLQRIGRRW